MKLGVNLSFAVKRWVEPDIWARIVRERLSLNTVQFSYDLLDPWWPEATRKSMAREVRKAAADWGLQIDGAFSGLANYCYDGLLHPDKEGRAASLEWWKRAFDIAADIGANKSGGPLGGMSVTDAANPKRRDYLYNELLDSLYSLSKAAKAAGLEEIQIECTPLAREIPYNVDQARHLIEDLNLRCALPVTFLVDVGHALYQPLYGGRANTCEWLNGLGPAIGGLHLQNTDFQSDSHWGWPDSRGKFEVAAFASEVRAAGLAHVPAFLEVFYPFELDDESVLDNITSSVSHCRREYLGDA